MMSAEELRQYKAKQLRYKKPIARDMNLDYIREQVYDMGSVVQDIQWFVDDEDNLVHALAGDEDEAWEFKMAFSDLAAELDQFETDLDSEYIPDCFDDLFPAVGADYFGGFLGWDSYENDYYGIAPYEYSWAKKESEKRICRMTKKEMLAAIGACLKVYTAYVALQYRYDCLAASLNIIQNNNLERLQLVKAIDEQYEKAEASSGGFKYRYDDEVHKFENLIAQLPNEYWL